MADKKVALIAGAAGGMGIPTVRRLARDGFRIAGLDLNATALEQMLKSEEIDGRAYSVDASKHDSVNDAVSKVLADFGHIDVLVNLIGWTQTSKFLDEENSYWQKLIGLNFLPAVYLAHAVGQQMVKQGGGRIVFVTSDAGKVGSGGEAVYAGLKGGVIAFAKSLARELARHNIHVNCTAPGPTDTPLEHEQDPEVVARRVKIIPFRRWAKPEEQAAAIAFLASDDACYITGQVLSVSGGLTMS